RRKASIFCWGQWERLAKVRLRVFEPSRQPSRRRTAGGELRLGTVSMYMGTLYTNNKPNTMITIQFTWEHCGAHTFGLSFVKSVACPRIEAHLLEELRLSAHLASPMVRPPCAGHAIQ